MRSQEDGSRKAHYSSFTADVPRKLAKRLGVILTDSAGILEVNNATWVKDGIRKKSSIAALTAQRHPKSRSATSNIGEHCDSRCLPPAEPEEHCCSAVRRVRRLAR